ncbi:DUF423 domain-containing protein [Aureispira sp. CCB-QB1]|uniref:DUF423 domain-containing protein n=1 Tax=Aureispira sp. CCB-QB1 TaxID=1313421 RepID=UPI0006988BD7|nr:DUF423 domain-containing protein [Aureispira sp. CCB-QB1]
MYKKLLIITGVLGMLAVILGAFGAHALANKLSTSQLSTYQTGIQYHYYHTITLLIVVMASQWFVKPTWLYRSAICFVIGILCFSGSIYLLACKELLSLQDSTKIIGPITPIGGLFFIAGWAMLVFHAFRYPTSSVSEQAYKRVLDEQHQQG